MPVLRCTLFVGATLPNRSCSFVGGSYQLGTTFIHWLYIPITICPAYRLIPSHGKCVVRHVSHSVAYNAGKIKMNVFVRRETIAVSDDYSTIKE